MFCSEEKIPYIIPFDHLSQYIKTDQNDDKKDFYIHHFGINFSTWQSELGCFDWLF